MIVKEWTVDEQGRLRVSWVKQEQVSPLSYVASIEATLTAADAFRTAPAVTRLEKSNGSPKTGKWDWIHTVLHNSLP